MKKTILNCKKKSNSILKINDKIISGKNIIMKSDGQTIIDDISIENVDEKIIKIEIYGDVDSINTTGDVNVKGNVSHIDSIGNIVVNGDICCGHVNSLGDIVALKKIKGDIDNTGNITVKGSVEGNIENIGDINIDGDIIGDIKADKVILKA